MADCVMEAGRPLRCLGVSADTSVAKLLSIQVCGGHWLAPTVGG